MWVLIRSKWPSMLGVGFHPVRPPARLTGPVCTPWMPMRWKISHSCGSPSEARKDSPGRVIIEIG